MDENIANPTSRTFCHALCLSLARTWQCNWIILACHVFISLRHSPLLSYVALLQLLSFQNFFPLGLAEKGLHGLFRFICCSDCTCRAYVVYSSKLTHCCEMHAFSYIYIIISLHIGFLIFKANYLPLKKQYMFKFDCFKSWYHRIRDLDNKSLIIR